MEGKNDIVVKNVRKKYEKKKMKWLLIVALLMILFGCSTVEHHTNKNPQHYSCLTVTHSDIKNGFNKVFPYTIKFDE